MKWLRTLIIFNCGDIATSADWKLIHESYVQSIESIDFPEGTKQLKLRKKSRRSDGQWNRNGVVYLKNRFLEHMEQHEKWQPEADFKLDNQAPILKIYPGLADYQEPITSDFGKFDFLIKSQAGMHVAIEWETGNISSSHRSLNKLVIALITGKIQAGVLILPSRKLYEHLTDRIGNISELSGYLVLWKSLGAMVKKGLLAISIVEHDELTEDKTFPYLPTGKDGRAAQFNAKRV